EKEDEDTGESLESGAESGLNHCNDNADDISSQTSLKSSTDQEAEDSTITTNSSVQTDTDPAEASADTVSSVTTPDEPMTTSSAEATSAMIMPPIRFGNNYA